MHEYGLQTTKELPEGQYDIIVLTVSHNEFLNINLKALLKPNSILYDVKGVLTESVSGRL